ncbi:zinc ribbon domain-containing protein [Mesorhizobium abyssinicae]|uniref:zinc ribbon domain-containing protein n=1 Tax=Mesorhizobium abyssinicae TaxID=1209958 RepID=UPI003396A46D
MPTATDGTIVLPNDLYAGSNGATVKSGNPPKQSSALRQIEPELTLVKYLFSRLTKCACCGGGYTMISADLVGCATARNKGTCDNRKNIRRDKLETRVLNALHHHLMDPELFAEFCKEFTQEMNRLRMEARSTMPPRLN